MRRYICGALAAALLATGLYMLPQAEAGGETRTMTLYSVNTKEKLTTTYMVNGRHVPSELAKINQLLRDWRRNKVTKIDPKTIDLVWELHADLGSRAPIHIISGYRSAETNALLKNIGRNVAKRSMHIQGKAIDLYFPDVPTERVRNSALVREVGGVGYYPRSGSSGFVHVDSGRVRHWPGIGKAQLASIRRDYRKTVGARLGRGQAVQVAMAETPAEPAAAAEAAAEFGYPTPMPRPRPIEVLMAAAAQMIVEPVAGPAPVHNFSAAAARPEQTAAPEPAKAPEPTAAPKVNLALAQMIIQPVAAPVPTKNFAQLPSPARDTLGSELEADLVADVVVARVAEKPRPEVKVEDDFLTALRNGISAGARGLLAWPAQLISGAESLLWQGPPKALASARASVPISEADEPFPPITDQEAAELEVIIAALRSKANYDSRDARGTQDAHGVQAPQPVEADRLSIIRARKGDLILTAPIPRYGAALAVQPVSQVAAQSFQGLPEKAAGAE